MLLHSDVRTLLVVTAMALANNQWKLVILAAGDDVVLGETDTLFLPGGNMPCEMKAWDQN